MFLPFNLYRVVHQMHHMHLATERDTELWPFVLTKAPRWLRRLAAFLELTVGLFYSPFIFLRVFVGRHSLVRSRKVRRRVWAELALAVAMWATIIAAVTFWGVWKYFLWLYLAPALIAANLQNWRKYIEHVGLTGNTVNSSTRSIVPKSWLGHVFAYTLLHEPYHGVHHQNAGLPHAVLPQFKSVLTPKKPGERVPFMSYRQALPGFDSQSRQSSRRRSMARFVSEWAADLVSKYEFVEKRSARLALCLVSSLNHSHQRAAYPFAALPVIMNPKLSESNQQALRRWPLSRLGSKRTTTMARCKPYVAWIFKSPTANFWQSSARAGVARQLCCKCSARLIGRPPER